MLRWETVSSPNIGVWFKKIDCMSSSICYVRYNQFAAYQEYVLFDIFHRLDIVIISTASTDHFTMKNSEEVTFKYGGTCLS